MTISPSDFGNAVDSADWNQGAVYFVLPCIEIPAKWCDGDETGGQYHRHRARAHVDVAAGEEINLRYRLDNAADQQWDEVHADSPANDWTSSYSTANETPSHVYAGDAVPNETAESKSHRFTFARIQFRRDAASAQVELNGFQIGWPMDSAIAADAPKLELGDRSGAHHFDSYHSGSAYHIMRNLLGTYQRLLYRSAPRIATVMADDR